RDFIETREPDASGTYTYSNIARGRTSGVELESGLALREWRLDASYDHLRARDLDSGGSLLGRPANSARASITGPLLLGVHHTLSALYTGRTPLDRVNGVITREREGWTRVDARLLRAIAAGGEISVGVTNLFDRELFAGWPGFTGRQMFGGVSWKLGKLR
ncbi:MAG: TonB-dependent receptor, partial [Gemmatimonadaceae bacterium]